jgi:mono/diheme cytochrome c family protein
VALIAIPALSAAAAPAGSAAAGEALFANKCAGCHTIERLAGLGGLVRNDMRKIDPQMATLGLLWDADVANLGAYLNSVAASGLRGKQETGRTAPGRRTQWRQ